MTGSTHRSAVLDEAHVGADVPARHDHRGPLVAADGPVDRLGHPTRGA